LVAIIGSLDRTRQYDPPLRGITEQADRACRELGGELLRTGCDLLLFSSKAQYVEASVAAGYVVASTPEAPGRIVARPALHQDFTLDLPPESGVQVQTMRATSSEWEVAFYRSVLTADAVVLIGGGQSTRVAGIIAIAQGIPLLPVAAFGGGASQVWVNFDRDRQDVSEDDMALLGAPWSAESAGQLVAFLHHRIESRANQRERERRDERRLARALTLGLVTAFIVLVASLAGVAVAPGPGPATTRAIGILVAAPMLAAIAGAIIRNSFGIDRDWFRAGVRGLGAGAVSVLLYVASQLLAVPALFDQLDARRLLFFVIPLGFGAGFTFDLVFDRLRTAPDLTSGTPPVVPASGQQ
jgi:hypothetical protein